MIGIIDYGAGNVGNVKRALLALEESCTVLRSPELVKKDIDFLILPGVGAFAPAMIVLRQQGWNIFLQQWAKENKPILGICLGLHLLCESSEEDGYHEGLGLLEGHVCHLRTCKCPHMGWNSLEWIKPIKGVTPSSEKTNFYYFVHSYGLPQTEDTVAITRIEERSVTAICLRKRVAAFQFHPERSGNAGLSILGKTIKMLRGVSL